MCEVAHCEFNNDLGCNISLSVSKSNTDSVKRAGLLGGFIRKSSPNKKVKKVISQNWFSFFAKKPSTADDNKKGEDKETAELIAQLQLEGRSDADIAMHLSHIIHEVRPIPTSPKENANIVTQWLRDVQQLFKEEFGLAHVAPEFECDLQAVTVSISSAPFYGAPPPDMDMTYEELANLEPVYVGSRCVNNLPSCHHDGSPLPGEQTKCPVCLCEFAKGESLKSLPCVHFFHKDCIDTWLMVGHTCPICKALVE
jgi:hypothetical protein